MITNKKNFLLLCFLLTFAFSGINYAQVILPRPSQAAKVFQKVGITDVTIDYSRPGVKNRTIWGGLVP